MNNNNNRFSLNEYLLCDKHCSELLMYIISLNPHNSTLRQILLFTKEETSTQREIYTFKITQLDNGRIRISDCKMCAINDKDIQSPYIQLISNAD